MRHFLAFLICSLSGIFAVCAKEYKLTAPPITIEPPLGFVQSERFNGFEQLETFATIKLEESEQSVSKMISEQLKSNLATLESENVTISGLEGLLIKHSKTVSGTDFHQHSLFFGDNLGSVKIVASYPATMDKSIGPMLKQTLLGVKMRRLSTERLFNNLAFVIKDQGNLTYQMRTGNSVVLKDKAPYDQEKAYQPTYIVSHLGLENPIDDLAEYSSHLLQSNRQFVGIKEQTQVPTTVAGVMAYKVIAHAKEEKNRLPVVLYQVVVTSGLKLLLIQAAAPQDGQAHFIKEFDHITDNIAFKEAAAN